jgi:hypothetical protein
MAINPYSTPSRLEYRPLGLEKFAQPFSEMSKKLELENERINLTEDKLVDTDFAIKNLSYGTDPERAKALKEEFAAKRDAIAENLLATKDYRKAQRDLLKLQKLWTTHEEKVALEGNYQTWMDRVKEEKDRIGKQGGITKQEFEEWYNDELRKFGEKGGTSYIRNAENPEGTYNFITGKVGRTENLDEKLQKLELELGKAVPGQKVEGLLKAAGIDTTTMDKHFISTTIDEKNAADVARKVSQYLQTLPEYKPFFKEKVYYSLQNIKNAGQYDDYSQQLVNGQIAAIDKNIKAREEYLNSPKIKGDKEKDPEYQALLNARSQYEELKNAEKIDPQIVANLHEQQYLKSRYDKTALGNLLAYKNIEYDETFRDIPQPDTDGSGGSGSKIKDGLGVLAPTIYTPSNINSIFENISNANSKLLSSVKTINDIGGLRKTILRDLPGGSKTHNLFERQVAFRDAVISSNSIQEFKQELNSKGIKPTTEELNKLWKDFKSPKSPYMTALNNGINAGGLVYNNFVTGQTQIQNLKKSVAEDADFKVYSSKIGAESPLTGGGLGENNLGLSPEMFMAARLKVAGGGNDKTPVTDKDKWFATLGKLFDANNYTPEQLKKAGIDKNKIDVQVARNIQYRPLTMDQVARLKGFKNYGDAVLHDYDFGGIPIKSSIKIGKEETENTYFTSGLSGTPQQITNNFIVHAGRKGLKSEEMAYELLNDPKNQKILSEHFMTIDNVIRSSRTGSQGFAGLPGFDDEGNPEKGTDVLRGTGITPKIIVHNGQISLAVPYKHEGGTGTLTIEPQPGSEGLIGRIVRDNKSRLLKSNDPTDIQTYNTLSEAQFALIHGNAANDVSASNPANNVSQERKRAPITNIEIADSYGNPMKVKIVKTWQGDGVPPRFSIQLPDYKLMGDFATLTDLKIAMMQGR